jgi:hypothetical protein
MATERSSESLQWVGRRLPALPLSAKKLLLDFSRFDSCVCEDNEESSHGLD